jgi:hypothetical protein
MIEKLLWISGILAVIALLFRGSVILGLYLGVVPGLLLAIAPSVFLYLAGFAVLRWLGRGVLSGLAADAIALVAVAAVGVVLALPGAIAGRRAYAAAATGDIVPFAPVRLVGHIKLERDRRSRHGDGRGCDALCAALLETQGVLSVTLAGPDVDGATYALGPATGGMPAVPNDPGAIVEQLPQQDRPAGQGWQAERDTRRILRDTVTARWALRAAEGRGLFRVTAPARFDMTIASRDALPVGRYRVAVAELVVSRGDAGEVLLRRQRVTAAPLAFPLHLWPQGAMMDQGFGFARRTVRSAARYAEIKPVEILFLQTTLARPVPEAGAAGMLRARLADAAATGGVQGAEMALVAPWLATLSWRTLDDADVALLGRLIADPGVQGLDRLYDGYASAVAPALRPAIARRLRDPATDDRLRNRLNDLVRHMPAGTYTTLLPDEAALLADRDVRLRSSVLAGRLSDQGAAALPLIVQLLEEDTRVEPWARRRWMIADLRRALARLGKDGAPALPLVSRLFEARPSPITNTWRDAQNWRVAMVRMGRPVETLPFPDHLKPETVARDREQITKRVAGDVRDDD